jgi:ribosomal protein S3
MYSSTFLFHARISSSQEVSWKLEQKNLFQQICRSTFQQIEKCQYVKGICICCSGQLNGA